MKAILQKSQAFSLIESLVVVCILTIILTFAIPSFGSLLSRSQIESKANIVFDMFQLARSMAINHSQYVTLCPSAKGNQCNEQWQQGVMAFIDSNKDRAYSANESIIAYQPKTTSSTLHSNQLSFTFSPLGSLKGRMGSVITCPAGKKKATSIRLLVSQMGRVRVQKKTNDTSLSCSRNFKY